MTDPTTDQPPVCYRCDDPLDGTHWIRLSTAHQGEYAEDYSDVETRVCPDCLAAMGLLEFSSAGRQRTTKSRANRFTRSNPTSDDTADESLSTKHPRLAPLRSLRGGD